MAKLRDDSPMPFGKYKGTQMADVPADYLMYLHQKGYLDHLVKQYIIDNIDVIRKEIAENQSKSEEY